MNYLRHLLFVVVFALSCKTSAQSITYSAPVDFDKYTLEESYVPPSQTDIRSIAFSNDGTKMFAVGFFQDDVYEYHLTNPFDLGGSVNSVGPYIGLENISGVRDIMFSGDGLIMYLPFLANLRINQYDLSTPFQVTSGVTLDNLFGISAPISFAFNNDGTRIFILQASPAQVLQLSLTTPYDLLGGVTNDGFFDLSGGFADVHLAFNSNGTKMYILGQSEVHSHSLSTPFTITSGVSYDGDPRALDVGNQDPFSLTFQPDYSRMYLDVDNEVYQYSREEVFVESAASDGSVNGSLIINLQGDTFFNPGGNLTETTHYTLSNVPDGLTPQIAVDATGTFATLTISGNATVWNDVSDIQFTFTDAAFINAAAATVANAVSASTNFGIDFNERFLTFNPSIDITSSTAVGHQAGQLDVSGELTVPAGMSMSSDGRKLFVTGLEADVHQYTLSTPFDITNGVSDDEVPLDVSSEEVFPQDVAFSTDGTKMFVVGSIGQEVNQYSLSTPFDISSGVSHDGSPFNVSTEDDLPLGIAFNNTGTKMYIVGGTGKELNQYSLSNPFDITSGVSADVGPLDLAVENTNPRGVAFNSTGTRLFIVSEGTNEVNQYTLANAFDITSGVTFSNSPLDISGEESNATDIGFSSDGNTMYILGLGDDEINQYSLLSPFSENVSNDGTVTGSATIGVSGDTFTSQGGTFTHGVEYSISNLPAGLTPNLSISGNGQAAELTLSGTASPHTSAEGVGSLEFTFNNSAFNQGDASIFTNASSASSNIPIKFIDQPSLSLFTPLSLEEGYSYNNDPLDVSARESSPRGLAFNNDGTSLYITGSGQDRVHRYSLASPYDISTATFAGSSTTSLNTTSPNDLHFSPDGSRMYILGTSRIEQFSLSTPWQITSGVTLDGSSVSITSENGAPNGIAFDNTGTKLFITGTSVSEINQYTLSTPFDVTSGMTFDGSPLSPTGGSGVYGITFNKQGTKLFTGSNGNIYEYHLSNPFDITSGVTPITNPMDLSDIETFVTGFTFNNDGSKLVMTGVGVGSFVNQIELEIAYDVSTVGASHEGEYDVFGFHRSPVDVTFSADGMTIFILGSGTSSTEEIIDYFSLTVPFDITSMVSHQGSLDVSVSGMSFTPTGMAFNPDGSKLYVVGSGTDDKVFQYSLTTPYDLSSGVSYDDSPMDVSSEVSNPSGIAFSADGIKMFIAEGIDDEVIQYSLATPFNTTSGVSYDGNPLDISSYANQPLGLEFANGGTLLLVTNFGDEEVVQFELNSPYDITAGVVVKNDPFDVSGESIRPVGISITPDGLKMHLIGSNPGPPFDRPIEQYSLNDGGYFELETNIGDVRGQTGVGLIGETFTNQAGTLTSPTHFVITGVPAGLIPEINVSTSGSVGFLELNGNASPHESTNDVADLVISFQDAAFSGNDATAVLNTDNQNTGYGVTFLGNNQPVYFSSPTANFQENASGTVLDINANNGENGDNDFQITYTISGGDDQNDFNIDMNSGDLTFSAAPDFENPVDADTDNTYEIEVTADDGGVANNTSVQSVTIIVTDVDEDPVFTSSASADFDENGTGTAIDVDANDGDGGSADTGITYSLSGGVIPFDFEIDGATGEMSFTTIPDFENPTDDDGNNDYEIIVLANDGVNTSQQSITINVTDVNEDPVFILPSPANPSVSENTLNTVYDANANDGDGGMVDVGITYSISGGLDQSHFDIDGTSGEITFLSIPDFEIPADSDGDNIYEIQINADDGVENTNQTVSVTVTNVDENPVFITSNTADFTENDTGTILDIDANDGDGGAIESGITYAIDGGADPDEFDIDTSTGELTFSSSPDFESPQDQDSDNDYEVRVVASDGVQVGVQDIVVSVTNVEENPIFTSSTVGDFTENGTGTVLDINANDGDGGSDDVGITYSISGGDDQANFGIDTENGILTFNAVPDFENPIDADSNNEYVVQITADDSNLTSDQTITITVTNENEVPVFTSANTVSFIENGTGTVIDINANDGDGGLDDVNITYAIEVGSDQDYFSVDASTGRLTFVSSPDFENPTDGDGDNIYIVLVSATDGTNTSQQTVTVEVTNLDEVPVFSSASSIVVSENSTGTVIDVEANDGDGGASDSGITYTLTGGEDQARFDIDPNNGAISFTSPPDFENPVDADLDNEYLIQVSANDGVLSSNQTISINVEDINEAPLISNQTFSIDENSPNGTSVDIVVASDDDGDVLAYSITNGNTDDAFAVAFGTGLLTVFNASALDFETTPSFALTVEVNDGNGGSASATVIVNLNDLDESSNTDPIINDQSFAIDENSPNGTSVGTVIATDDDGDILTFTFTNTSTNHPFALNPSTGELTVADIFLMDFEATPNFPMAVQVNDGKGGFASATITVSLNDIDESSNTIPTISDQLFTIDEHSPNGTSVGTVIATDDDGDDLFYSFAAGITVTTFDLDSNSGELTVASSTELDFETTSSFAVTVRVNDGNGGVASATVTVNLNDVDESPNTDPIINNQSFTIDENSPNGTPVGTILATDPDSDPLTFTLTNTSTNDPFELNPSTGELTVADIFLMDFEATPNFSLTVQVNDNRGGFASATITVSLNDIDESSNTVPTISDQAFTIDENSPNGTSVGTVIATDDDGDDLFYSFASGITVTTFDLDSNSGELTVASSTELDFETASAFALTVRVNDGNGGIASATISIALNDIDESSNADPVINDQTFTIDENSPPGTSIGTVVATDEDGDALTFSITSGNTDDAFAVNSNAGELTVMTASALNFETTPTFSLIVQVKDGNGGIADANITINLIDLNEVLGTEDLTDQLQVYPNPFSDHLVIELGHKPEQLTMMITDLSGKVLLSLSDLSSSRTSLDLFNLSKGIYLLHVETEHSKTIVTLLRD